MIPTLHENYGVLEKIFKPFRMNKQEMKGNAPVITIGYILIKSY